MARAASGAIDRRVIAFFAFGPPSSANGFDAFPGTLL
jgi:hypothetical protein